MNKTRKMSPEVYSARLKKYVKETYKNYTAAAEYFGVHKQVVQDACNPQNKRLPKCIAEATGYKVVITKTLVPIIDAEQVF